MSAPGAPRAAAPAPAWPMYRAMVGIGMLCGLAIALTFSLTRPAIERNHAQALERAVFSLFPAATRWRTYVLDGDGEGLMPADALAGSAGAGERVHAAFDASGALAGIAVEASGMGYADTIDLLYGYAPAREQIVGLVVLASRETPGLGDRIRSDPAFLANFTALDVRLADDGTSVAHPVTTVKYGTRTEPWQIDAITGATVSSNAVGAILAASTQRWLALLREQLPRLAPPPATPGDGTASPDTGQRDAAAVAGAREPLGAGDRRRHDG